MEKELIILIILIIDIYIYTDFDILIVMRGLSFFLSAFEWTAGVIQRLTNEIFLHDVQPELRLCVLVHTYTAEVLSPYSAHSRTIQWR